MASYSHFEFKIGRLDDNKDIIQQSYGPVKTDRVTITKNSYDPAGLMSTELFGNRAFRCSCKAPATDYTTTIYTCATCKTIVGRSITGFEPKLIECGCHMPRIEETSETGFMCSKCYTELLSESIRDNARSYIKLNHPILSPALAGNKGALLARIVSYKRALMEKIVKSEILFDTYDFTFKPKANADLNDVKRYLYGAEAIRDYVLPTFDFEIATLDYLTNELMNMTAKQKISPLDSYGFFYNPKTILKFVLPSGESYYYNPLATKYMDPVKFGNELKKYMSRNPGFSVTKTGLKYLFYETDHGTTIFNEAALPVIKQDVIRSIIEGLIKRVSKGTDPSIIQYVYDSLWTDPNNRPVHPEQVFIKDIYEDYDVVQGYLYAPPRNRDIIWYNHRAMKPEVVVSECRKLIKDSMSKLALFVNGDMETLKGMIIENIRVTPPNTRPEIDGRRSPTTKLYADLIQANNMLGHVNKTSVEDIAYRVGKLYNKVTDLLTTDSVVDNMVRKSIIGSLSGKKGFIRGKMMGKRVDYSGRTVIVGDPTLNLGQCALPFWMCKIIFEYHLNMRKVPLDNDEAVREALEKDILKKVPVLLNRAPTLHRPSLLGFYVVISPFFAIGLHPLVCAGYNADFDGDAMGAHVPLSAKAVDEVKGLMMAHKNIYAPASGRLLLVPNKEMLYGLNVLTRDDINEELPTIEYAGYDAVYEDVVAHKIHVNQKMRIGSETLRAGNGAMRHCLPRELWGEIKEITNSNIESLISMLAKISIQQTAKSLNLIVRIGFACATIYSPTAAVLGIRTNSDAQIEEFYKNIKEYMEAYANGFLCDDHYSLFYQTTYDKLRAKMEASIIDEVGRDNGYSRMVLSGARGTESSLVQIFAAKGLIKRNDTETFNAVIPHGHLYQLNSIEHFISAFGSRHSLQEKTQKTADTGYESRRMGHADSPLYVVTEDCGTELGITLSRHYMRNLIDDPSKLNRHITEILTGRCLAGTSHYLTREEAARLAQTGQDTFVIRSLLTCENPCCSKCYGVDLTTMREANVGTPVGFIASQSVGEVGTQLTMRTFHGGGVVSKGSITSAFDRMRGIIHFAQRHPENCASYDPVAWATGKVITEVTPTGMIASIEGSDRETPVLPRDAVLKDYVRKGEGMCKLQGDFDIHELMEHTSLDHVKDYILMSMYFAYTNQKDVSFKHFEALIYAMERFVVYESNDPYFKVGQQMLRGDCIRIKPAGVKVFPILRGIDAVTQSSIHGLTQLQFEDVGFAIREMYYNKSGDMLIHPLNRQLLGLPPMTGTYYPKYLAERVQSLNSEALV